MENFNDDLEKRLKDSEFAAYHANAQAESAKELLRQGIITELNESSDSNTTTIEIYEDTNELDRRK